MTSGCTWVGVAQVPCSLDLPAVSRGAGDPRGLVLCRRSRRRGKRMPTCAELQPPAAAALRAVAGREILCRWFRPTRALSFLMVGEACHQTRSGRTTLSVRALDEGRRLKALLILVLACLMVSALASPCQWPPRRRRAVDSGQPVSRSRRPRRGNWPSPCCAPPLRRGDAPLRCRAIVIRSYNLAAAVVEVGDSALGETRSLAAANRAMAASQPRRPSGHRGGRALVRSLRTGGC